VDVIPKTLEEARALVEQVKEGKLEAFDCPCCEQRCELYPRVLYTRMARFMIQLVKVWERTEDWVNVRHNPIFRATTVNGDYGYLPFWGLAVQKPNDSDPTKNKSGFWKPTPLGVKFVYNMVSVSRCAYIYNNEVQFWDDRKVFITDALGKKFNYQELMEGVW